MSDVKRKAQWMSQCISLDDENDGILKRWKEGACKQWALLSEGMVLAAGALHGDCLLKERPVQWRSLSCDQGFLLNCVEQNNKSSKNRLPASWA